MFLCCRFSIHCSGSESHRLSPMLLQQLHSPSLCSSIPLALSTLLLIIVLTLRSHFIPLFVFLYWLPKVFRTKSKFLSPTCKRLHNLILSTFSIFTFVSMMEKNKFLTLPLSYPFNLPFLTNWPAEIPTSFLLPTSWSPRRATLISFQPPSIVSFYSVGLVL